MLETPDQVRAYIGAVCGSDWWLAHGWPETVEVRANWRPGRTLAWGGYSCSRSTFFVSLPTWAWSPGFIAHELGHVVRWHDAEDLSHGDGWVAVYGGILDALHGDLGRWASAAAEGAGEQLTLV